MNTRHRSGATLRMLSVLAIMVFATGARAEPAADLVLKNARIYTANDWAPWAHAVAIRGGKIIYVGDAGGTSFDSLVGPDTRVHDLGNRVVLPGLIDAHTHPHSLALTGWHTILPFTTDIAKQLLYLKAWSEQHPRQPLLYAEYYPTQMFGAQGPNKAVIDKYIRDIPVIWEDFSDHSACLNSKALELMGIDRNTPDPEPGTAYFVRDAEGNPTGWVKEGAYRRYLPKLYSAIHWSPPQEVTEDAFGHTLGFLSSLGVTGIFEAIASEDSMKAAALLDRDNRLHMYYEGAVLFGTLAELSGKVAVLRDWQHRFGGRHVRVNTMKLFLDGTNEVGTSALLQPFANDPKNSGTLRMSKEDLTRSMLLLNREGIDLHIHLVGDRAFRVAMDTVEAARAKAGSDWRIQVTLCHDELVDDKDFPRAAKLGVILNWTPHWSGGYFQGAQKWLGMERYNRMYRFQPFISTGATVTFGSDTTTLYEWSRANPFVGMQIAHTRLDVDPNYRIYGLRKPISEMLQLRDLVKGYTINAAIQIRRQGETGSIEVGKSANLSVLDKDVFTVPADEISSIKPLAVMFEGKIVHGTLLP